MIQKWRNVGALPGEGRLDMAPAGGSKSGPIHGNHVRLPLQLRIIEKAHPTAPIARGTVDEKDQGFGVLIGDLDIVHGLAADGKIAKGFRSSFFQLGGAGPRLPLHFLDFGRQNQSATGEAGKRKRSNSEAETFQQQFIHGFRARRCVRE
jgi:hypothetical protein